MVARLGTVPARFEIVPSGGDVTRLVPGSRRASSPPPVLYHRRIDCRKGVLDLLRAFARLQGGRGERAPAAALREVRQRYAWDRVAAQVVEVYERLAGSVPDNGWTMPARVAGCRFRAAPHLL